MTSSGIWIGPANCSQLVLICKLIDSVFHSRHPLLHILDYKSSSFLSVVALHALCILILIVPLSPVSLVACLGGSLLRLGASGVPAAGQAPASGTVSAAALLPGQQQVNAVGRAPAPVGQAVQQQQQQQQQQMVQQLQQRQAQQQTQQNTALPGQAPIAAMGMPNTTAQAVPPGSVPGAAVPFDPLLQSQ